MTKVRTYKMKVGGRTTEMVPKTEYQRLLTHNKKQTRLFRKMRALCKDTIALAHELASPPVITGTPEPVNLPVSVSPN